jgi:beta-N-acetylhexosaminidase
MLPLPLADGERLFVVQFSGAPASAVEDYERSREEGAGPSHSRFVTAIGRALARGQARVHEQVRSLDPAGHEYKQLLMAASTAQAVVAVTSRAKQHPLQARAVADLAMIGKRMVVIASREPYDADVLPADATIIASYGDDPHALRAAADVILGAGLPQGKLPVRLSAEASPTH